MKLTPVIVASFALLAGMSIGTGKSEAQEIKFIDQNPAFETMRGIIQQRQRALDDEAERQAIEEQRREALEYQRAANAARLRKLEAEAAIAEGAAKKLKQQPQQPAPKIKGTSTPPKQP
jgi:membrane protein involved in colicin uptake